MEETLNLPTITVDTLVDENNGDLSVGDVSLREAIAAVEAGGTIDFATSLATENAGAGAGVIELSLGSLTTAKSLSIQGLGADLLTVKGDSESAVFDIDSDGNTGIEPTLLAGLTVTGGSSGVVGYGGALTIKDSVITGNADIGVATRLFLTLENTDVTNNGGEGVYTYGDLTVVGGSISNNQADGINSDGRVTVTDSTISNNGEDGISSTLAVSVERSVISGNTDAGVDAPVGAFGNYAGSIDISNSTVENNGAGLIADAGYDGDIAVSQSQIINNSGNGISGGTVTVAQSTVGGNAGIGVSSTFLGTVTDSSIVENSGGGIVNSIKPISRFGGPNTATLRIDNSTVSGNGGSTAEVGGISSGSDDGYYRNRLEIVNSTVSGNSGTRVGGVELSTEADEYFGRESTFKNTIVAANTGATTDVLGIVTSQGYNLIGDRTGADGFGATGDLIGTASNPIDPKLGAIKDNGGPTLTQALLPGSPAIDAGDPSTADGFDQRGADFERVLDGDGNGTAVVDIGAFEAPAQDNEIPLNPITGTRRQDRLIGTKDGDLIKGLRARDNLFGLGGNDVLEGNAGDDTIRGGAGDDVLGGGKGRDLLRGDSGSDTFVYNRVNEGTDIIIDFELGTDVIDLSAILSDRRYDSATPFEDYVRIGSAGRRNSSVEVLDINRTRASGSPVFRKLAVVNRVTVDQIDASSFLL